MNPANIEILVITISSLAEGVLANQLVGFDGGAAGAGEAVLGVAKFDANVGEPLSVVAIGVVELKPAGNIAAGDRVYSNLDGAVTADGQGNSFGVAITGGGPADLVAIRICN